VPVKKYNNFYHYNRNYGCRFKDIIYKGYRTIVIENEKIQASILVERGTDINDFLYKPKDLDFLFKSPLEMYKGNPNPFPKERSTGAFLDIYQGGWQELIPSMNLPSNYKGSELGYHGEAMFEPWKFQIITDNPEEIKIKFFIRLTRSPLYIEKIVSLVSDSTVLSFEESVINEADEEFKLTWGHHPVFGAPFLDENCVIDIPEGSEGHSYEVDFSGNSVIAPDRDFLWPLAKGKGGEDVNISKVMPPEAKTAFNAYIKNIKEGWYGITNLDKKIGFGLKWDHKVFKYLMFWFVYRGFYNSPFYGRTYNIGIEPWSSVPGEIEEAIKLKREITLEPGESIKTNYSAIVYESEYRIKGFDKNNNAIPI
jgi:hypothetical protein